MSNNIYLPSIRSKMGDWVFYSCVMRLADIAKRVTYAEELHKNKNLSQLIQRTLDGTRANVIRDYLIADKERFFGSLVIAVYGGSPSWSSIDLTKGPNSDFEFLNEYQWVNIGFLSFNGEEKLFALDGQHRLAGIKKAVEKDPEIGSDSVTVIFLGHANTDIGLQRTRKLFTTLNKNAKAVSKSEIISLDENDAVAVTTRRLVEESPLLFGKTISYSKGTSIPKHELVALTNITNLYDVLCIFLGEAIAGKKRTHWRDQLRPAEGELEDLFDKSLTLLNSLKKHFPELKAYFSKEPENRSALPYRHDQGGSILFRPIGLLIFAELFSKLYKDNPKIDACVKQLAKLPTEISDFPYRDVIWSSASGRMLNVNKSLTRDLLLYRLNLFSGKSTLLIQRLKKINPSIEPSDYGL
jgi:DNA sulfur modification protein DndB